MKKLLFLIPALILTSSLSSCGGNKKVNTLFGINNVNNRKLKSINISELNSLMDNKSTFILIQTTNTSCQICSNFVKLVNKYIQESGLLIYSISYNEMREKYEKDFYLRDDSPTFHVVIQGKNNNKYEKSVSTSTQQFFEDYETFKKEMNNTFSSPSLMLVDENELDSLYKQDKKFSIYFSKSDCYECKILTNTLFYEYGQSHLNMKTIYVLDYKGYESKAFDDSRNKYGLNEESDPKWGYKKGAIPMIYTINPKGENKYIESIDQGFTFGNDIIDDTYKVTSSYYTDTRIKNISYTKNITNQLNKQYKESEVKIDSHILNEDTNIKIYKPVFNDFMDYINTYLD